MRTFSLSMLQWVRLSGGLLTVATIITFAGASLRGPLSPGPATAACSDTVLVRAAKTYTKPGSSAVTFYEPVNLTAIPGRRFLIEAMTPSGNPVWTARIMYGGVEYFGAGDVATVNTLVSRVVTPAGAGYLKVTLEGPTGSSLVVRITQVPEPLYNVYTSNGLLGSSSTKTYTRYFSYPDSVPASPHRLLLTNGNPDTTGAYRTNNTQVWLNSSQVLFLGEVTTGKAFITRDVTLESENTLQVTIPSGNANKKVWVDLFGTDVTASGITIVTPDEGTVTAAAKIPVTVHVDEPESGTRLFLDGEEKTLTASVWSDSLTLPTEGGLAKFAFSTVNGACLTAAETLSVIRVTSAPWLSVSQPAAELITTSSANVTLVGSWAALTNVLLTVNGDSLPSGTPTGSFSTTVPLAFGANTFTMRARDVLGSSSVVTRTVIREPLGAGAAEPAAPAIATTHLPGFLAMTAFLYGPGGVQVGADAEQFSADRVAVIRGRVVQATATSDTVGLAHVHVSVPGHEEYGYTESRASGNFDLVVNGGGQLALEFTRSGFAPARRTITVPWRDYVRLDDVALQGYDPHVVTVDLRQTSVARGSSIDEGGSVRASTMIFKSGTQATGVDPNGNTAALGTSVTVRATEFTVGSEGPRRMPAELPSASAYTHCVELSVPEAAAQGYEHVRFSPPVAYYIENFLGLPVGTKVPVGSFDPDSGWKAEEDGLVIGLLATSGGIAVLDLNNDAVPDTGAALASLGIDQAELERLAELYQPGETLWRSRVDHFSTWDWNFPFWWPENAILPSGGWPYWLSMLLSTCHECPGSVIEMENQTLREAIPIVGTPFALHYSSARVAGNRRPYQVRIPLRKGNIPSSVTQVHWSLDVAGRHYGGRFGNSTNGSGGSTAPEYVDVEWNALDGYEREVVGTVNAHIKVGYAYANVYGTGAASGAGRSWGNPPSGARLSASTRGNEGILWTEFDLPLGTMRNEVAGLGDWSITPNHFYDFSGRGTLYRGDGAAEPAEGRSPTIGILNTGSNERVFDLAYASDGALYYSEANGNPYSRIKKRTPDGTTTVVAGQGNELSSGATFAVAPSGELFVADPDHHRIARVKLDGTLQTLAGSTTASEESGDGGLAANAHFKRPSAIALGSDGTLYVGDRDAHTVRRIAPDGIITRFAGTGSSPTSFDDAEKPAVTMPLNLLQGHIRVGAHGEVYIAEQGTNRIRRVSADGVIHSEAVLPYPVSDVGIAPDGVVYAAMGYDASTQAGVYRLESGQPAVRVVGAASSPFAVSGSPRPALSVVVGPLSCMGFNRDGLMSVGTALLNSGNYIALVRPVSPGYSLADYKVVSRDAIEEYVFDVTGRHLRTLNAVTGGTLATFTYQTDASGNVQLRAIYDANKDSTVISRAGNGAVAITATDGQVTALDLSGGRLGVVTDPAAHEVHLFPSLSTGLLDSLRDARGVSHHFEYELDGRLKKDLAGDGFSTSLSLAGLPNDSLPDRRVEVSSALNHGSSYAADFRNGRQTEVRTATGPDGLKAEQVQLADQSAFSSLADGTRVRYRPAPDQQFGMQAPYAESLAVWRPSGVAEVVHTTDFSRTAGFGTMSRTVEVNHRSYLTSYTPSGSGGTVLRRPPSGAFRQVSTTVDTVGRPLTTTLPGALAAVLSHYDGRGRLDQLQVGTRRWEYHYEDERGRLTRIVDPLNRETRFAYDAADRLRWQILPSAASAPDTVYFEHDTGGNLTALRTPRGQFHRFALTPGELTRQYDPPDVPGLAPDTTHYEYDADRALTTFARPDGQSVSLGYDDFGRLESVSQPRGTSQLTYHASGPGRGRVQTIGSPDGVELALDYDGALLTGETWDFGGGITGSVGATFDANEWPTDVSVNGTSGPASKVTYGYDADGLVTSAAVLSGVSLLVKSADKTAVLDSTRASGLAVRYGHNPYAELTSTAAWYGADTVFAAEYGRDDLGRIARIIERLPGGTTDRGYWYDERGRLICVRDSLAHADLARYGYDRNGNRIGYLAGADSITAAYDEQDRLVDRGAAHYTYTANGERTARTDTGGTLGTSYDLLGNLITVGLPAGDTVRYEIDGRNRRVGRWRNGSLTARWLYANDLNVVGELDASGALHKRFVYASRANVPDLMVVRNASGPDSTYGIVADHLGSVRAVVNVSTGYVAQRLAYDAWGVVTEDTNPGFTPLGFACGLYDATTALVRFGARDYDPTTGIWTCRDPIGFAGGSENLFTYAAGDPVDMIDPAGTSIDQDRLNTIAGFLDCLTFGLTKRLRDQLFSYNDINPASAEYAQGAASASDVKWQIAFAASGKLVGAAGRVEQAGTGIDPNKLNHIFGDVRHNLGPIVRVFGTQEAAFTAVESATQVAVEAQGVTGIFETTVTVAGENVVVRGRVIDGVARIGTFFIP